MTTRITGANMNIQELHEELAQLKSALAALLGPAQSAEERARRLSREKALRDRLSLIDETLEAYEKAWKEGYEQGRQEARQHNLEVSTVIGGVQLYQELLKQPQTPQAELTSMTLDGLRALATALEAQATNATARDQSP